MTDQQPQALNVEVENIGSGKPVPEKYAFCAADGKGGTKSGGNASPEIRWGRAPEGTKSYALIVVDRDVPADFSQANKKDQPIAKDAPRRNFYHWLVADIPASVTRLKENNPPIGIIGKNDFGERGKGKNGYDGPCPPWNDERLHHYHFIVRALDVPSLGLKNGFSGKEAESAMRGHILAEGEIIGSYTTNPKLK